MSATKLDRDTINKITDSLRSGSTRQDAAKVGGISRETFYKWFRNNKDFADEVLMAEKFVADNMVPEVKASLFQRATGYVAKEKRTEYGTDKEGRPIVVRQVIVEKPVPPDVAAAIFVLTNLDPENWKNRQTFDGKVKTEEKTDLSLASVPDDLLEQVIRSITGEK